VVATTLKKILLATSTISKLAKAKKRGSSGTGGAQDKPLAAVAGSANKSWAVMPGTPTRQKVSFLGAVLVVTVFFAHRTVSLEATPAGIGVSADGSLAADSSASSSGSRQQQSSSSSRQPLSHPIRQFDKLEETGEAIHANHEVLARYQGELLPYTLLETLPHNRAWFTQGLFYHEGYLWEGTGLYGRSKVYRMKMATGDTPDVAPEEASAPTAVSTKAALAAREVVSSPALDKEFFGEGLALVPAKLGKLSYTFLLYEYFEILDLHLPITVFLLEVIFYLLKYRTYFHL